MLGGLAKGFFDLGWTLVALCALAAPPLVVRLGHNLPCASARLVPQLNPTLHLELGEFLGRGGASACEPLRGFAEVHRPPLGCLSLIAI